MKLIISSFIHLQIWLALVVVMKELNLNAPSSGILVGTSEDNQIDLTLPFKNNFDNVDPKSQNTITWIGHASCLLKMSGIYVLTDPIFSQHCSAIQMNVSNKLKRFRQPGLNLEEMDKVDAVVISHDHYDHLDRNSVTY